MRHQRAGSALVAQGQTLLHAEAVLFVDDDQPQARESHALLHQRVSADHHRRAGGHALQRLPARPPLQLAGQPFDRHAERLQPALERSQVLFGQQFRGGRQRDLVTGFHRGERGERGDERLARADVALHQAQHRTRRGEVGGDLRGDAPLCGGRDERQGFEQACPQGAVAGE